MHAAVVAGEPAGTDVADGLVEFAAGPDQFWFAPRAQYQAGLNAPRNRHLTRYGPVAGRG
jgi:hypothetical protein